MTLLTMPLAHAVIVLKLEESQHKASNPSETTQQTITAGQSKTDKLQTSTVVQTESWDPVLLTCCDT